MLGNYCQNEQAMPEPLRLTHKHYFELRRALRSCDEFRDAAGLRAIFVGDDLIHWRDGLPEANSQDSRVSRLIDYLLDKRHANGTPAIILLLKVLASGFHQNDERHREFLDLAARIEQAQQLVDKLAAQAEARTDHAVPPDLQPLLDKVVRTFYNHPEQLSDRHWLQTQFAAIAALSEHDQSFVVKLLSLTTADPNSEYATANMADLTHPLVAIEHYLQQVAGESAMALSAPTSYAAFVFSTTAKVIMRELSSLEKHRVEWPDLIIGDEVKDQSLASLKLIDNQMKAIKKLLHRFSSPDSSLIQRDSYEGFINSVRELTDVLETVDSQLPFGRVPEGIVDEMERLYDDLVYYSHGCFLWLNHLSEKAQHDNKKAD